MGIWGFIVSVYTGIIYQPVLNGMIWLYNTLPGGDLGVVIIVATLIIRILTYPLMKKQLQSQKQMGKLQGHLKEIQEKHKNDKQARDTATFELYKEHGVNPLSGCLPLLLQIPIMIALYQVVNHAVGDVSGLTGLYSFVQKPETLNTMFIGLIDISKSSPLLVILSSVAQYINTKQMTAMQPASDDPAQKAMQIQTTYLLPIFSLIFLWKLPAGIPLYLLTTTVLSIIQTWWQDQQKKVEVLPAK